MLHHMNRAVAGNVDPRFENVVLLLHGDGTNGAQNNTFLDSSTNNFNITRNGNTTQGSYNPYGASWSNYFDGTGDRLTFSTRTLNGDFCGECWFYRTTSTTSCIFGGADPAVTNSNTQFVIETTGAVTLVLVGVIVINAVGTAVLINQWNHIAWVRSGTGTNNCAIFVNGVRQGQGTSTSNVSTFDRIGAIGVTKQATGYISNARMVIGSSVYDPAQSTITVPTAPLTAITNTQLLTCQSNRFLDNSSNNLTITRNGDVSVQPFSPVTLTLPYSTAMNGGSGYFDGTGDYLTVPNNTAFDQNVAFTVEMWVYSTTSQTNKYLYSHVTPNYLQLAINGSGTIFIDKSSVGSQIAALAALPVGAWTHIVMQSDGTTLTLYINGVSQGTLARGTTATSATTTRIGAYQSTGTLPFIGYISDVRTVKGTAVYTGNFTPPSAPLTAITNTQLLCNMTNGAIFDNSAKNNLETVGNAQISTSVKKFGTGSLAFDGTGDWLAIPSSQNISFGTGNFTTEAWVYVPSTASANPIICIGDDFGATGVLFYITSGAKLAVFGGNASIVAGTTNVSTNTWHHVAWVRSGTTNTIYLNGTSEGTATNSVAWTGAVRIGAELFNGSTGAQLNGYIDDLRITKGVARYTANFTPSQQPFPNR